jgi:hypothetical protein
LVPRQLRGGMMGESEPVRKWEGKWRSQLE